MSLIIDGYNVLNVVGILGRGIGPGGLHQSRLALLNFLAESLAPEEIPRTIVVFDAHNPPWGLPRSTHHRGIQVCFASQYEEADDLIEELIGAECAPRRLTVVSSDHRIQRAAKRRKAHAVDSDVWYAELLRSRAERLRTAPALPAKPPVPLLAEDVNYWMRQFGGESALMDFLKTELTDFDLPTDSDFRKPGDISSEAAAPKTEELDPVVKQRKSAKKSNKPTRATSCSEPKESEPSKKTTQESQEKTPQRKKVGRRRRRSESDSDKPRPTRFEDLSNPFPPGYGEDLLGEL
jgi:uncharacterized protein